MSGRQRLHVIRRGSDLPKFARREAERRRTYARRIHLGHATLVYRQTKPQSVSFDVDEYGDAVLKTETFAWLVVNGRRIGAFQLFEFDPAGCGGNDDFIAIMDVDQEIEARLSIILTSAWNITDLPLDWPILEFRSAWIAPAYARGGLFAKAANAIIGEIGMFSLLIMCAFPLEYEGNAPSGTPQHRALRRRQRAMIRHYKKVFGVEPLPGQYGKAGWLWKPHSCADVPEPKSPRRRSKALD